MKKCTHKGVDSLFFPRWSLSNRQANISNLFESEMKTHICSINFILFVCSFVLLPPIYALYLSAHLFVNGNVIVAILLSPMFLPIHLSLSVHDYLFHSHEFNQLISCSFKLFLLKQNSQHFSINLETLKVSSSFSCMKFS